MTRWCIMGSR